MLSHPGFREPVPNATTQELIHALMNNERSLNSVTKTELRAAIFELHRLRPVIARQFLDQAKAVQLEAYKEGAKDGMEKARRIVSRWAQQNPRAMCEDFGQALHETILDSKLPEPKVPSTYSEVAVPNLIYPPR